MARSFQSSYIPYTETGWFSKISIDYLQRASFLKEFYAFDVNDYGVRSAIEARKLAPVNRALLVDVLKKQYETANHQTAVEANIDGLLHENTFTVCTAHQPNIFTGHLYFIYKILHTIKLAEELKKQYHPYNFVPVFFMGSEDADLEELNHVIIDGKKYTWHTRQTGAVGSMKVDDLLLKVIDEIASRLAVEEYGKDIIDALKKCFQKNASIAQSTFLFIHHLFGRYGLIVFLPESEVLKKEMTGIFEEDIFENIPSAIVNDTVNRLSAQYKVQANPRAINLFYMKDNIRNRIVQKDEKYFVDDTDIAFTADELRKELHTHPGRFSPNVILRGIYQEKILPNIAFIGGGGELAYWLELKTLFDNYHLPFPLLILRNSFLLIENKYRRQYQKLGLTAKDLFQQENLLLSEIVKKHTPHRLNLEEEKFQLRQTYTAIEKVAKDTDVTLAQHAEALETAAFKKIEALEKKMLRAEKRKFADIKNQLAKLYSSLFPGNNLQERTENFMLFYARWGNDFFDVLYKKSLTLEQEFCIIEEE